MSNAKRNIIFGVILTGCILCSLLQTSMNTALPTIMAEFNITAGTVQWLTSGYTLAMGIMTPATAFLLKRFPTRKLFLTAIGSFVVGALLAVAAPDFATLMIGRIIQALGTSVVVSMTQVVIFNIYPGDKRGSMMGLYGLAVGAAPIISPTIAGLIIDAFGWKYIFIFTLVIAVIVFIIGAVFVEDILPTEIQSFDTISMVLCSIGLLGLMYGLSNITSNTFFRVHVAVPLMVGLVFMVLFVRKQLGARQSFLNLKLFVNAEFRWGVIASMLLYAGMMGASILIPMYIQSERGLSATLSGMITMPGALANIIISPFAGKIYDKLGIRKLFIGGSIMLLAGCIGLSFLSDTTSIVFIIVMFTVRQLAIGCMMMPIATWSLSTLSKTATVDGTAILSTLRTIAGSIGSALFVSLMSAAAVSGNTISGFNVAFIGISITAAIELIFAVILVGRKKL